MKILEKQGVKLDCLVATRPECVTQEMNESPVKFLYGITLNQFGSFIKESEIFVLPLLNTNLSAGHMAMLEAMANEKPVIVTDIPAIRDYVSEEHVTFYKPDSASDLADKIKYVFYNLHSEMVVSKQRQAKKLYEDEYSFKAMLKRIIKASLD